MARVVMASGALYRDAAGAVVLVKPSYKDGWDLPGGIVEPGESPADAVRREVVEELGCALPVGRLLTVDWAPDDLIGDKLLWVFDGGVLDEATLTALRVDGEELTDVRAHPLAVLDVVCPSRLARRIRTALLAADLGRTLYAEHGTPG
jgi:8-oxo-dGTP pyrophosphatase MutT (NUDIX family)